jgi:hypothetical protein
MREVTGNGALYFDPYDEASAASALELLIDSSVDQQVISHARAFSWTAAQKQLLSVYDDWGSSCRPS